MMVGKGGFTLWISGPKDGFEYVSLSWPCCQTLFIFLAKGGRVILSRNRDFSGAHAIGTQCDLWAIAS